MNESSAYRLRDLTSARAVGPPGRSVPGAVALVLRLACVAILIRIGYVHLHLWQEGYRYIPTNGPFFLADAIAAFVLAAALLAWPRPPVALLAAGFTASTLAALLISLSVGLFGFRESISASYAVEALVTESIVTAGLVGWVLLVTARRADPVSPAAAGSDAG